MYNNTYHYEHIFNSNRLSEKKQADTTSESKPLAEVITVNNDLKVTFQKHPLIENLGEVGIAYDGHAMAIEPLYLNDTHFYYQIYSTQSGSQFNHPTEKIVRYDLKNQVNEIVVDKFKSKVAVNDLVVVNNQVFIAATQPSKEDMWIYGIYLWDENTQDLIALDDSWAIPMEMTPRIYPFQEGIIYPRLLVADNQCVQLRQYEGQSNVKTIVNHCEGKNQKLASDHEVAILPEFQPVLTDEKNDYLLAVAKARSSSNSLNQLQIYGSVNGKNVNLGVDYRELSAFSNEYLIFNSFDYENNQYQIVTMNFKGKVVSQYDTGKIFLNFQKLGERKFMSMSEDKVDVTGQNKVAKLIEVNQDGTLTIQSLPQLSKIMMNNQRYFVDQIYAITEHEYFIIAYDIDRSEPYFFLASVENE